MKNENKLKVKINEETVKHFGKGFLKGCAVGLTACGIYIFGYLTGAGAMLSSFGQALNCCYEVNPDLKDMINEAAKIASERIES